MVSGSSGRVGTSNGARGARMSLESREANGQRIERVLAKHERGEALSEQEWTIVQYALGGGCHACGGSRSVTVAVRMPRVHGTRRNGGRA